MATHSCNRVHIFPILLCSFMIIGTFLVFLIAVLRNDVSPYVPFISEAGAKPPEAGIFSIILCCSSVLGIGVVALRFMVIEECHQGQNTVVGLLNKTALPLGVISMMGMIIVASYPMVTIIQAHNTGAFIVFVGCILYGIVHTVISFKLHPTHNSTLICWLRLTIISMSIASFLIMSTVQSIGFRQWLSTNHSHWSGKKTPNDEGFTLMLVSASAEWLMFLSFLAFFVTFAEEFKNTSGHLSVQLLVPHFDEPVVVDRNRRKTVPETTKE